jgi:hypothetical protein
MSPKLYPHPCNRNPSLLSFSVKDKVGALDDVLGHIRAFNISLTRIESRPSKTKGHYEFFIDFNCDSKEQVDKVVQQFKNVVQEVRVISGDTDNGKLRYSSHNRCWKFLSDTLCQSTKMFRGSHGRSRIWTLSLTKYFPTEKSLTLIIPVSWTLITATVVPRLPLSPGPTNSMFFLTRHRARS